MIDNLRLTNKWNIKSKLKKNISNYYFIYNKTIFIDNLKKDIKLDKIDNIKESLFLLFAQPDAILKKLIKEFNKQDLNLLLNLIKINFKKFKVMYFSFKLINYYSLKSERLVYFKNYFIKHADYIIKSNINQYIALLEYFLKDNFFKNVNSITNFKQYIDIFKLILTKIDCYKKKKLIEKKKNNDYWYNGLWLINLFLKSINAFLTSVVSYLINLKLLEQLDYLIKLNIVKINLKFIICFVNLNPNLILDYFKKNVKVRKFIIKNKLKLLNFVDLDFYNKMFSNIKLNNEKTIENLILNYNKDNIKKYLVDNSLINIDTIFNIDWDYIYKNTVKDKKKCFVDIILLLSKIYDNQKDEDTILSRSMKFKLSKENKIKIINFSLQNNININLRDIIIKNIKNYTNIYLVKNYLPKIHQLNFNIIKDIIINLMNTEKHFQINGFFVSIQNHRKDINKFHKLINFSKSLSNIFLNQKYKFKFEEKNVIDLLDKIKEFCLWKKNNNTYDNNYDSYDEFYNSRFHIKKIMYFLFNINIMDVVYNYILEDINNEDNFDECPICMEPISIESGCKLKCKHIYHKDCILKCFKTPNYIDNFQNVNICLECPYCRYNILEFKT